MQKVERMHSTPKHRAEDYDIMDALRHTKNDIGKLVMRVSLAGLMLFHGLNKLIYGTEQVDKLLANVGLPVFFSFGVLLAEVVAPVMLILGLKTRLAAFLIMIDMFAATLIVHSADVLKVSEIGGWMVELNALYFFGALAIMFFGSGRYAVTKGHGYLD